MGSGKGRNRRAQSQQATISGAIWNATRWAHQRVPDDQIFTSLEEFWMADERRRDTGVPFGRQWHPFQGADSWGLMWDDILGEVYVFNDSVSEGPVVLLGIAKSRSELEDEMVGWERKHGDPGGLEWLASLDWDPLPPAEDQVLAPDAEIVGF